MTRKVQNGSNLENSSTKTPTGGHCCYRDRNGESRVWLSSPCVVESPYARIKSMKIPEGAPT